MELPAPAADHQVPLTPDAAPAADHGVPQTPDSAPADAASAAGEYPEEWLVVTRRADDSAVHEPSPGALTGPVADFADAQPFPRRDRNHLASSSRSVRRKGHYSRRDPRHDGPRFLTWEGGDICRQWNRGCCAPVQEGPSGHFGVCKHWRRHVCSQCGSLEHPAFRCTAPEAEWPPKG